MFKKGQMIVDETANDCTIRKEQEVSNIQTDERGIVQGTWNGRIVIAYSLHSSTWYTI